MPLDADSGCPRLASLRMAGNYRTELLGAWRGARRNRECISELWEPPASVMSNVSAKEGDAGQSTVASGHPLRRLYDEVGQQEGGEDHGEHAEAEDDVEENDVVGPAVANSRADAEEAQQRDN